MTTVVGMLWWIVFGALLGWVAAWWLGRSSQRLLTEPVLQIVERRVDNPQHVARIATLENEVTENASLRLAVTTIPALQARIDELLAAPPRVVEKVVTRTLDRVIEKPVDRIVEKPVDRIVEKVVERVVDRVVDRPVPDTAALAERDAALRAQRQRVEHLDALATVLAGRLASAGRPAPQAASAAPPAPIMIKTDAPAADVVRPLRARIEHLEALAAVQAGRLSAIGLSANAGTTGGMAAAVAGAGVSDAGAYGATVAGASVPGTAPGGDIELVEGIGPKIAELLRARGLGSFGALADASPGTLREILDNSGPAYRIADPSTWPEQARLAADGRWDELKSLQDSLTAGRR